TQIEKAIRDKSKREAEATFKTAWDGFAYLHSRPGGGLVTNALSYEERKVLSEFHQKMLVAYIADEQERAVDAFVATYSNLIVQFPDLVEQVREEAIQEMGQ
ncbi:hypothetical protein, partial [Parvimonas sp. D9]